MVAYQPLTTPPQQKRSKPARGSFRPVERDERHDQAEQDGRAYQNGRIEVWSPPGEGRTKDAHRAQRQSGHKRLAFSLTLTPEATADGSDPGAVAQDIFHAIKIRWNHLVAKAPGGGLNGADSHFRRAIDPTGANALMIKHQLRRMQYVLRQIGAGKPEIINVQTVGGLPAQLGDGDEGIIACPQLDEAMLGPKNIDKGHRPGGEPSGEETLSPPPLCGALRTEPLSGRKTSYF